MQLTIEETEETLYNALKAMNMGWVSRAEIARQIGKNQLNQADMIALDLLVKAGRLEKVIQQAKGNVTRFVYRVRE